MAHSWKVAWFALAFALAAAVVTPPCAAQNSAQDFVDLHNAARADVGVGPVSWDDNVAAYAKNYAAQRQGDCALVHSGGPYGENIMGGAGGDWSASDAVGLWQQLVLGPGGADVLALHAAMKYYSSKLAWFALAFAMAAAVVFPSCAAQNSAQDFVNLHNTARADVGVGPVSWDNNVAAYAQNYAAQRQGDCALKHSSNSPYGENIFVGGAGKAWSASDAVGLWVAEKQYYHHDTNSCSAPAGQSCGHYTQVVWRKSTAIGCGRVVCSNGGVFIICSYNPPGNFVGQSPY
ncbi:hypothetical protein EJB05_14425, partial [Eragrostis curvula]